MRKGRTKKRGHACEISRICCIARARSFPLFLRLAETYPRGCELAAKTTPVDEITLRELHRRIVARSQPEIGGLYSTLPRRIAGSPVVFPNAAKIPQLMKDYGDWLAKAEPEPAKSFDAHFRLAAHPFSDGNGRTARLLMNLRLLRERYPPVAVPPEDRKTYLETLEYASTRDDIKPFQKFMHQRLDVTLGEYLIALQEALPPEPKA